MKHILLILIITLSLQTFAQKKGTLYLKGGEKIAFEKIKKTEKETVFYYIDSLSKKAKTSVPNWLVDSIVYNGAAIANTTIKTTPTIVDSVANTIATEPIISNTPKEKNGHFSFALGFTLGNFLEFNNPTGTDKKSFSFTTSIDLNYNYTKPNAPFTMTHELHYILGVQKEALTANTNLQRVQDDLLTLHDISFKINKKRKWNINAIVKTNTSLFTIYDGDYFKDVNNLGKVKAFASPYSLSIAPGIKYDFNDAFRISLSPYSFELFGVTNNEIRNKGIYITDVDGSGNFKKSAIKKQGIEMNIWFDKNVKEWLEMQYRLSFNSDYAGGLGNNGIMDGLFITRAKIWKNLYLTHRATLYNNLTGNLLKPHFTQTVQLTYSQTL